VRVLVDTHVVLWLSLEPSRVSSKVLAVLADEDTERLLSAASVWELAVKWRSGKLPLPAHPREWTARLMREMVIDPLPVRHDHALLAADLPDHHRDPFDRLLVAQAQVEGVPIVTADPAIAKYDVQVVPATA
jgi:PIN domain nuclease of toxin-antitoxin system